MENKVIRELLAGLTSKSSNIIVRVDSSVILGSGHVMRSLTLAGELKKNGMNPCFICRELPGNLNKYIEAKGYKIFRTPEDFNPWDWRNDAISAREIIIKLPQVDWLIIDNYQLDERWEKDLRSYTRKIMVIDDLADRKHDCDLLLDQNYYRNLTTRYDKLVPESCKKLLGPSYALLRPEFETVRRSLRPRDGSVRRIFLFFGSTDPTNETGKALQAIKELSLDGINIDIVVGESNPRKEEIQKFATTIPGTTFYCQVENMAELMNQADLTIGAGGTAMWERCFLGLPAMVIIVAENQRETVEAAAEAEMAINLGWYKTVSVYSLANNLAEILTQTLKLKRISHNCLLIWK